MCFRVGVLGVLGLGSFSFGPSALRFRVLWVRAGGSKVRRSKYKCSLSVDGLLEAVEHQQAGDLFDTIAVYRIGSLDHGSNASGLVGFYMVRTYCTTFGESWIEGAGALPAVGISDP